MKVRSKRCTRLTTKVVTTNFNLFIIREINKIMSSEPLRKELHQENRLSWNEATKAHNSHKGNQAKFFFEGGCTLFPEEKELLGNIAIFVFGSSAMQRFCCKLG